MSNMWFLTEPDSDGFVDVMDGETGMCVTACLPKNIAQLIQQAPDLLAFLEKTESALTAITEGDGWDYDEELLKSARGVIECAKGVQS